MKFIKEEYNHFYQAHQNVWNILFHVFCGAVFTSCLILLLPSAYYAMFIALFLTLVWISLPMTMHVFVSLSSVLLIFFGILSAFEMSNNTLLLIAILFYFLPELSHIITQEKTAINIKNITVLNVWINIMYLLPFSVKTLFYSGKLIP